VGFLRNLFRKGAAVAQHMEELSDHFQAHLGVEPYVLHEIVSDVIHLDVFVYPATDSRPWHFLTTCGVSALPMPNTPKGLSPFAEVCAALPRDWPLAQNGMEDRSEADAEANYWPIRTLKLLGRLPHTEGHFLRTFISIPSSYPDSTPYSGTEFYGVMLAPPAILPDEAMALKLKDKTVLFPMLAPMTLAEMDFKMQGAADCLWELMLASGRHLEEFLIVNKGRKSLV
jgi:hypothetical protein